MHAVVVVVVVVVVVLPRRPGSRADGITSMISCHDGPSRLLRDTSGSSIGHLNRAAANGGSRTTRHRPHPTAVNAPRPRSRSGRPAGRSALAGSTGQAALPAAATYRRVDPGRRDRIRPRAHPRDNAMAGIPHLVYVDLRDPHDRVTCPPSSAILFRPIAHMSYKAG